MRGYLTEIYDYMIGEFVRRKFQNHSSPSLLISQNSYCMSDIILHVRVDAAGLLISRYSFLTACCRVLCETMTRLYVFDRLILYGEHSV